MAKELNSADSNRMTIWRPTGILVICIVFLLVTTSMAGQATVWFTGWQSQGTVVWTAAYETGQDEIQTRLAVDRTDLGIEGYPHFHGARSNGEGFAVLSTGGIGSDYRLNYFDVDGVLTGFTQLNDFGYPRSLAPGDEGNFYVAGESGNHNVFLVNIDAEGSVIWNLTFLLPAERQRHATPSVATDGDGNAYFAYSSIDGAIDDCDRYWASLTELVRVSPSGAISRHVVESHPGDRIHAMAVTDEGRIFLAGQNCGTYHHEFWYTFGTWADNRPVLMEVTAQGDVVERRVFDDWYFGAPDTLRIGPQGDLWLSGTDTTAAGEALTQEYDLIGCKTFPVSQPTCTDRGFVARVSQSLDVRWKTHMIIGHESRGGGFEFHPAGGIIVSGETAQEINWNTGTPSTDVVDLRSAYMAHVSEDGTVAWVRAFDGTTDNPAEALARDRLEGRTHGHFAIVQGGDAWSIGRDYREQRDGSTAYTLFLANADIDSETGAVTGTIATTANLIHHAATDGVKV